MNHTGQLLFTSRSTAHNGAGTAKLHLLRLGTHFGCSSPGSRGKPEYFQPFSLNGQHCPHTADIQRVMLVHSRSTRTVHGKEHLASKRDGLRSRQLVGPEFMHMTGTTMRSDVKYWSSRVISEDEKL